MYLNKLLILKKLQQANTHLGGPATGAKNSRWSRVATWGGRPQSYIFGFRAGQPIFDLDKTVISLRRALHVIQLIIRSNGHLLFVNTNPKYNKIIQQTAKYTNQSFINHKWIGGFLTNWNHMLNVQQQFHAAARFSIDRQSSLLGRPTPPIFAHQGPAKAGRLSRAPSSPLLHPTPCTGKPTPSAQYPTFPNTPRSPFSPPFAPQGGTWGVGECGVLGEGGRKGGPWGGGVGFPVQGETFSGVRGVEEGAGFTPTNQHLHPTHLHPMDPLEGQGPRSPFSPPCAPGPWGGGECGVLGAGGRKGPLIGVGGRPDPRGGAQDEPAPERIQRKKEMAGVRGATAPALILWPQKNYGGAGPSTNNRVAPTPPMDKGGSVGDSSPKGPPGPPDLYGAPRPPTGTRLGWVSGLLLNAPRYKKMQKCFEGVLRTPSGQSPDCVIIFNATQNSTAIYEAHLNQIPIISVVDSNIPNELYNLITYPIPANYDSVQFIYLFCNCILKTLGAKQTRPTGEGPLGDYP